MALKVGYSVEVCYLCINILEKKAFGFFVPRKPPINDKYAQNKWNAYGYIVGVASYLHTGGLAVPRGRVWVMPTFLCSYIESNNVKGGMVREFALKV